MVKIEGKYKEVMDKNDYNVYGKRANCHPVVSKT